MIVAKVIESDGNGPDAQYVLEDFSGNKLMITNRDIKEAIRLGYLNVVNMKLTSDGKLIILKKFENLTDLMNKFPQSNNNELFRYFINWLKKVGFKQSTVSDGRRLVFSFNDILVRACNDTNGKVIVHVGYGTYITNYIGDIKNKKDLKKIKAFITDIINTLTAEKCSVDIAAKRAYYTALVTTMRVTKWDDEMRMNYNSISTKMNESLCNILNGLHIETTDYIKYIQGKIGSLLSKHNYSFYKELVSKAVKNFMTKSQKEDAKYISNMTNAYLLIFASFGFKDDSNVDMSNESIYYMIYDLSYYRGLQCWKFKGEE